MNFYDSDGFSREKIMDDAGHYCYDYDGHVYNDSSSSATKSKYQEVSSDSAQSTVTYSKTRCSQPDSGLVGIPDEEIMRRVKDKTLSPQERKRYVTEEKYRDLRNMNKCKEKYRSKIGIYPDSSLVKGVETATGLTGTALVIYLVVSEGSRLFPPRNLIPIP